VTWPGRGPTGWPTSTYDPGEVTVARLLSHTSGLGVHGYLDHSPRRVAPPDLVETLSGVHLFEGLGETLDAGRMSFGNATLVQEPGSGYRYSGAGYGVLQLLVEDVTGEPFATFVQREVTEPLAATSLRWAWTPGLQDRAPTPYSEEGRAVEYRQLTMHGIGSAVGTVSDFAHFVAAAVEGPNGEPAGRGVLQPDTVARLMTGWPEAGPDQGLAYPLGRVNDVTRTVLHSGANTGWMAFFVLDTIDRVGFVIASPSGRAGPLHDSVFDLWLDATYGPGAREAGPPAPPVGWQSQSLLAVAAMLGLILAIAVVRFITERRTGHRAVSGLALSVVTTVLPWVGALLFGWYTVYSSLPLYLPVWYPDLWRTTGSDALMVTLAAWVVFSGVRVIHLALTSSAPTLTTASRVPRASGSLRQDAASSAARACRSPSGQPSADRDHDADQDQPQPAEPDQQDRADRRGEGDGQPGSDRDDPDGDTQRLRPAHHEPHREFEQAEHDPGGAQHDRDRGGRHERGDHHHRPGEDADDADEPGPEIESLRTIQVEPGELADAVDHPAHPEGDGEHARGGGWPREEDDAARHQKEPDHGPRRIGGDADVPLPPAGRCSASVGPVAHAHRRCLRSGGATRPSPGRYDRPPLGDVTREG
jgi:hypothetical protein